MKGSDESCCVVLNLKNFKLYDNMVYCQKHVPAPKHTEVSDSVSTMHALGIIMKLISKVHQKRLQRD